MTVRGPYLIGLSCLVVISAVTRTTRPIPVVRRLDHSESTLTFVTAQLLMARAATASSPITFDPDPRAYSSAVTLISTGGLMVACGRVRPS